MSRTARSRKCPRCLRLAALGSPVDLDPRGRVRVCNYCGHECGIDEQGNLFGRGGDVTVEPGARGGRLLPGDGEVPS